MCKNMDNVCVILLTIFFHFLYSCHEIHASFYDFKIKIIKVKYNCYLMMFTNFFKVGKVKKKLNIH